MLPPRLMLSALVVCGFLLTSPFALAQSDSASQEALDRGKLYESKRQWDLAYEAYREADKLSHHSSPEALLHLALIEKKAGLLPEAAYDAKKAANAAGGSKSIELQARLLRATVLTAMANKPSDNKLKDAEAELRAALALDPQQPVTHLNLATVLLKQERDSDGVAELRIYVAMPNADPDSVAEAQKTIANPVRARTPFVPAFSLTTMENQQVSNASLRGKVALLDFWGSWCPPCRESIPILKNLQKKYSSKPFQLIGISSDDDEDAWKAFVSAQRMDWSEYLDSSGDLQRRFRVDSFPTYIVVDKDGVIRYRQSGLGPETQGELEDAINKALKKESNPELAKIAAAGDAPPPGDGQSTSPSSPSASVVRREPSIDLGDTAPRPRTTNMFHSQRGGFSYRYPEGWKRSGEDSLRSANDHLQEEFRAALLKQSAQDSEQLQVIAPAYVFYASPRGDGSPERPSLSSLSIKVEPTRSDDVNEPDFRRAMDRMASATGLKALAPVSSFEVRQHKFVRADFERSTAALHYCVSYIQAVSGESLLHIDITAESPEQLNTLADTLQSLKFDDAE